MRAAGYVRVSTEEQAERGYSIDEQERLIREAIGAKGWQPAGIYRDAGWSGAREDRPELQRMLADLEGIDVVVIWAMDRLTRDLLLFAKLAKLFNASGVRIESLTAHVDLETPEGEAMAGMAAVFGQFERKRIAERVKTGVAARARHGKHHGRAPYGYDAGMQVIESQAAVIVRIFHEYAVEGISQREIARRLNRDGIGAQRGQWTQGSISKQLGMPAYIGKVRINGQVYDGHHEPIIDLDLWHKAQQLRQANVTARRGKDSIAKHLLGGGMLKCGVCGAGMDAITRTNRPGRKDIEVYACSTPRRVGLDACSQPTVKRQTIDEAIYRFVVDTALDLEATKAAVIEQSKAKLTGIATLRDQAVRDQATAEARLTRVRRDYQDGRLDADDWSEQRAELTEALEAANAQVERLTEQHADLVGEADQIDTDHAVLAQLTAIRAAILGQAKDGSNSGVEAFRAALRRLFTGFELVQFPSLGKAVIEGVIWPQTDRGQPSLAVGNYVLIPRVRPEALNFDGETWDLHQTTLPADLMPDHRRPNRGRRTRRDR